MANTRRTPQHAIEFFLRDFTGDLTLSELAQMYQLPRNTLYRTVRANYSVDSIPLWELEALQRASRTRYTLEQVVSILRAYDRMVTPRLKEYTKTGHYDILKPQRVDPKSNKIKLISK